MLKWLAGSSSSSARPSNRHQRPRRHRSSTETVTDDPLAAIRVAKVDRPLEIYAVSRVNPIFDEEEDNILKSGDHGSPEFPGKSASSGYGSNRYNSSSEYSSSGAEETPRTSTKRHNRRPSGASAATLSPIPEGKVDYSIPRPVWPKEDEKRIYHQEHQLPDPPQELSNTISEGISDTINSKLDVLKNTSQSESSEDALRNLSVTLSHREPLTKMSRALSNSSSSSGGSLRTAQDDSDTARVLLLQRKIRNISVDNLLPPGGSSSSSTIREVVNRDKLNTRSGCNSANKTGACGRRLYNIPVYTSDVIQ
ncbi:hypothetical protein L9F63_001465, partial [Diploptera punctata]